MEISPESELTFAQEITDLEKLRQWEEGKPPEDNQVTFDFPVTVNRQVEYYLDFFQNRNRSNFEKWLARSGRYKPMIQQQLREAGLPEDLVYLAMIESGFNTRAYSKAHAVGLWQFIKGTGLQYDLTIDTYIDERRDAEKSTRAAIAYLVELYKEFNSWYLAVAAYNAGEGRIRHAIKKYNTTNFWELAQQSDLQLETKRYVPQLIAAMLIAKNPEKYGFSQIVYQEPLAYEIVEVPSWTALKAVSLAADIDMEELQDLNRELSQPFAPPTMDVYRMKVPAGKKKVVQANLPRVHAVVTTNFKTHKVLPSDTLASLCKRYSLTRTVILKSNNLQTAKLQPGQRLRIPYRTTSYEFLPEGATASASSFTDVNGGEFILHKVQPGETVSDLADRYNVPTRMIAGWNDIDDISKIRAGQQLALYIRRPAELPSYQVAAAGPSVMETDIPAVTLEKNISTESLPGQGGAGRYIVQQGDSLWEIARRAGVSANDIRKWNNLDGNKIYPGDSLQFKVPGKAHSVTYYLVRGGDSLWTIARKLNVSMEDIRQWNDLRDDIIQPGHRLRVKLFGDV